MHQPDLYPYLLAAVSRDNILPLTSRCNLSCVFCSHRQNPQEIQTYPVPPQTPATVMELAQFLDPQQKVIIGESATCLHEGEPFTHPDILQILQSLRQMMPQTLFALTTNGTLLSPAMIRELSSLQPLELTVSLNSVTTAGRRLLLHDPEPERAPAAVVDMARYNIPFHGSLVAMPHLTGWDDLAQTVAFLAEHGAQSIRVFLPGYTKLAPETLRFPLTLWDEVVTRAKEWTSHFGVPVIPEPAPPSDFTPEVYGVMRNTPAAAVGLLPGDVILGINGKTPRSRVDAFRQCKRAENPHLRIQRQSSNLEKSLQKERGQAPGFVVLYDFSPERLDEITAAIGQNRSHKPLLLSSVFALSLLQTAAHVLNLPTNAVQPVINQFFGGSIQSAGLLVINDLLTAAKPHLQAANYDLVLVPQEMFDHRGTDLTGRSINVLTEEWGIPVVAV